MPSLPAHRNILLCLTILALTVGAEAFDAEDWGWQWPVEIEPDTGGFKLLQLTPEVVDAARLDLGDLRLVTDHDEFVPYALRQHVTEPLRTERPARIINRAYVAGAFERAVLDFGEPLEKQRIRVTLSGSDYRRRTEVEGSDDGTSWATLRDDALLFHIDGRNAPDADDFVVDVIELPVNTHRFLRLTVHAMADEDGRFAIEKGVAAIHRGAHDRTAAPLHEVPLAAEAIAHDRRHTDVELDLGHRHLPVARLTVAVGNAYFYRGVELHGRNSITHRERRITETGTREIEVETPWRALHRGVIHRIADDNGIDREALALEQLHAPYRHLRLRIHDQDNPPLSIIAVRVQRRPLAALAFEHEPSRRYTLFAGHPDADPLRFDLARAAGRGLEGELPAATLGASERRHVEPLARPWTERYPALVWIALLTAMGILGLAVRRAFANLRTDP